MRLLQVCLLLLLCQQANALNKQLHALIAAPRPVAASACQPIAAPTIPAPAAPQAIPAQYLTDAPAITTTRDAGNSPTRYNAAAAWRRLQTAAAQADGRAAQQKLLKQGSDLIQSLDALTISLQIDRQSLELIELKAGEEGIDGLLKLADAQKRIAEGITLLAQYQRDFDALITPLSPVVMPRLVSVPIDALTPPASRYTHLRIDSDVTITQRGHFIVTIHFFYSDADAEPPSITQVTDNYDLTAMQSVSEAYQYPADFTAQIYELTRKTWRWQAFQWNRQPSERELQAFLAVINQ